MNKKGQASFVLTTLIVVIVTGFFLFIFSPTVNDFRADLLDDYNTEYPTGKPLEKLILYSLMPVLWITWILFSGIALAISVQTSEGIL
jgi:hypothetical protein